MQQGQSQTETAHSLFSYTHGADSHVQKVCDSIRKFDFTAQSWQPVFAAKVDQFLLQIIEIAKNG
jgi:hypothetical protein